MALKAKPFTGSTREPAPMGFWPAVCADVFGLAKVPTDFGPKDKLNISFQLGPEAGRHEYELDGEKKSSPFFAYLSANLNMGEKSTLRPIIEQWRGRPFTSQEEADNFEFQKLIGLQCQIQILHKPSKDGKKIYANVSTIVQAPATQKVEIEDYVPMLKRAKDDMPEWLRNNIFFDVGSDLEPMNPFTQTTYTDESAATDPDRDPDLPF